MVKCMPRFPLRRKSTPRPPPPPPKLALLIGSDYVGSPDPVYPPLYRARIDTKDFRELLIGTCAATFAVAIQLPDRTYSEV